MGMQMRLPVRGDVFPLPSGPRSEDCESVGVS